MPRAAVSPGSALSTFHPFFGDLMRLLVLSLVALAGCQASPDLASWEGIPASEEDAFSVDADPAPPPQPEVFALLGSELNPGEPLTLSTSGAPPFEAVTFVRGSRVGTGPCPGILGGLCLGIVGPSVLGEVYADAAGVAELTLTVPTSVPLGAEAAFQAVVIRGLGGADTQSSVPLVLTAEAPAVPVEWFFDGDQDGDGDPATVVVSVDPPSDRYVLTGGDCDDADEYLFTGAPELCDGQQNDCADTAWTLADEEGSVTRFSTYGTLHDMAPSFQDPGTEVVLDSIYTDRLTFCEGTFYGNLVVEVDMTIEGKGMGLTTLYGYGDGSVVSVDVNRMVVINDMHLTSGDAISRGGGVYVEALGEVELNRVEVSDCDAGGYHDGGIYYGYGGGLYGAWPGSTITLVDSIVRDNSAEGEGGGIYGYDIVLVDTLVIDNAADVGGGVFVDEDGDLDCTATVPGYGILSNTASMAGGGVYLHYDDWNFTDASQLDSYGCDFGEAVGEDNVPYDVANEFLNFNLPNGHHGTCTAPPDNGGYGACF